MIGRLVLNWKSQSEQTGLWSVGSIRLSWVLNTQVKQNYNIYKNN